MTSISVATTPPYSVLIGNQIFADIIRDLASFGNRFLIVCDDNTETLYGTEFLELCKGAGLDASLTSVAPGESSKSLAVYEQLLRACLAAGLDRGACLVALGGGVVGDLTGFVAATYLRGIGVVQVPTTLLSQVDSAVGGKTGINLQSFKNMVGAFKQPLRVYCDVSTLGSLPQGELRSGIGEVIKYGCILDADFFDFLSENVDDILALDSGKLSHVVARSCALKAEVVAQDEKESDRRRILNFGHTIGHAIELGSELTHGECVAIGMRVEAAIAKELGLLPEEDYAQITSLIQRFDFPMQAPDPEGVLERIQHDKKTVAGRAHYVLLNRIGSVAGVRHVDDTVVLDVLRRELCS